MSQLEAVRATPATQLNFRKPKTGGDRALSKRPDEGVSRGKIGGDTDGQGKPASHRELPMVQRALSGDSEALATLFARDRRRLFRAAFLLLRNKEDAEDAVQDGLLSAYQNLKSFQGRAQFSTWLTRIVLNAALMNRRRRQSRLRLCVQSRDVCEERLLSQVTDTRPDPERACASAEARKLVQCRVNKLSPLLRSAFYLRDVGQLSASEASKAARVRISAIKSRTIRARHRLANLLAAEGLHLQRQDFCSSRPLPGRSKTFEGSNGHD
jgi:RNA polymerase sigma-70 factor, ECF subfamily